MAKTKERWRPKSLDKCYRLYPSSDGKWWQSVHIFDLYSIVDTNADENMLIVKTKREAVTKCKELNSAIKKILSS